MLVVRSPTEGVPDKEHNNPCFKFSLPASQQSGSKG
jgi:hypothetical protein